jgi:hypothetical protein
VDVGGRLLQGQAADVAAWRGMDLASGRRGQAWRRPEASARIARSEPPRHRSGRGPSKYLRCTVMLWIRRPGMTSLPQQQCIRNLAATMTTRSQKAWSIGSARRSTSG